MIECVKSFVSISRLQDIVQEGMSDEDTVD